MPIDATINAEDTEKGGVCSSPTHRKRRTTNGCFSKEKEKDDIAILLEKALVAEEIQKTRMAMLRNAINAEARNICRSIVRRTVAAAVGRLS